MAVVEYPLTRSHAVIEAIIIGIVGCRDDVVGRIFIRADIGFGFTTDLRAEMEWARMYMARPLRRAGRRVEDGWEVCRRAWIGEHCHSAVVAAVGRLAEIIRARRIGGWRRRAMGLRKIRRIRAIQAMFETEAESQPDFNRSQVHLIEIISGCGVAERQREGQRFALKRPKGDRFRPAGRVLNDGGRTACQWIIKLDG